MTRIEPRETVLVELCAGSAAVSLRWLHPRAVPPLTWQGGKRAFADAILVAMGLRPGGGAWSGRVVLVDAGHWGEAWATWKDPHGRREVIGYLRAWVEEDPEAVWRDCAAAGVPAGRNARVAYWTLLQYWAAFSKPVIAIDGEWSVPGFSRSNAYRREMALEKRARGEHFEMGRSRRLPALIAALEGLDLSHVEVIHGDVRDVAPTPGAHVYIDPDYDGTTGYAHALPRTDALALGKRHRAAGCVVAISEAEPLALDTWHTHRLPPPHGRGRTWSKQQAEWLTLSEPPVGVLPFAMGACS